MSINKKNVRGLAIIFLLGILLYANILNAPFIYDDHDLLLANLSVRGISPLSEIWKEHRQKSVTFLTFAVNYRFGRDDPSGYHIVNVLIHVFTASFLYYAILLLFSSPELSKTGFFKEKELFALFVSLVFLAHPLQTQSVTYIWQRSECLSGLFYLASYFLYIKGRLKGKIYCYVFAAILFFVGFFAKGIIISLPVMVLLTEISFFNTEKSKKILKRFWPLLLLFIVLCALPFIPFRKVYHATRKAHNLFMSCTGFQLSRRYFYTQFQVIFQYIRLAFIPINQNLDHYFPLRTTFLELPTVASFAALVSIWIGAMSLFKKHRLMAFGIFWFFIGLLPTTFVLRESMWEHRVYLSMAGFSIFLISLLFATIKNRNARNISVICVIYLLSALTVSRNSLWRSPMALMEDTVRKSPLKPRANHVLGVLHYREGNTQRAFELFNKAIQLAPNYAEPYNNLGIIYLKSGETEKAQEYFEKARELRGSFLEPYINLATISLSARNYRRAEKLLKRSLAIRPTEEVYISLGNLYVETKELDKAQTFFQKALEFNPDSYKAYYSFGNVSFHRKDYHSALGMYKKAIELNPSFFDSYLNAGMAHYYMGDVENARQFLEHAVTIDPTRPDVYKNLAKIYHELKEYEKAENYFKRSQKLYREQGVVLERP